MIVIKVKHRQHGEHGVEQTISLEETSTKLKGPEILAAAMAMAALNHAQDDEIQELFHGPLHHEVMENCVKIVLHSIADDQDGGRISRERFEEALENGELTRDALMLLTAGGLSMFEGDGPEVDWEVARSQEEANEKRNKRKNKEKVEDENEEDDDDNNFLFRKDDI